MTTQQLTAFFANRSDATNAVDELVASGIPRSSIRLLPEHDDTSGASVTRSYDTTRDDKGFWASLGELFMPEEERYTHAEALHRGNIMVTVRTNDTDAAQAERILEQYGTIDLDEQETSWRQDGWSGYAGGANARSEGEGESIPVVEEQLEVGKRQVSGGRVKVRSYVVETPVSEDVTLRKESVSIERRPADRVMTSNEADNLFEDRTIEVEETGEEAVIAKTARVTGEVVVKKTTEQRTETISDTVRSTKVDVEDERRSGTHRNHSND